MELPRTYHADTPLPPHLEALLNRTPYIDRWGIPGALQPFMAEDVRLYGFTFEADPTKLAQLVTKYLNTPAMGAATYATLPFLPWVVVTFAHIGKLYSLDRHRRNLGWMQETEVTFWLFTPRVNRLGLLKQLTFFTPYLFVDAPVAIQYGREMYGFPKDQGWFRYPRGSGFPRGLHAPAQISVNAFGVPEFQPDAQWAPYKLIDLTGHPSRRLVGLRGLMNRVVGRLLARGARVVGRESWTDWDSLAGELLGRLVNASPRIAKAAHQTGVERAGALWPPAGHVASLKQFYRADDSRTACFQAIVEARISVQSFVRGGLLDADDYTLAIADSDTHPIVRETGLTLDEQGLARPLFAYWADFSFKLHRGRIVAGT